MLGGGGGVHENHHLSGENATAAMMKPTPNPSNSGAHKTSGETRVINKSAKQKVSPRAATAFVIVAQK